MAASMTDIPFPLPKIDRILTAGRCLAVHIWEDQPNRQNAKEDKDESTLTWWSICQWSAV